MIRSAIGTVDYQPQTFKIEISRKSGFTKLNIATSRIIQTKSLTQLF